MPATAGNCATTDCTKAAFFAQNAAAAVACATWVAINC